MTTEGILGAEVSAKLSERAVRMLQERGVYRAPRRFPTRETLIAALEAHGLPLSEAVLSFEERLGGLTFTALGGQRFELGVSFRESASEDDEEEVEEAQSDVEGLVWIGSGWSGHYDILMAPSGKIYLFYGDLKESATSVYALIEHIAMADAVQANPASRYTVQLRPPVGAELARALGVPRVDEASDDHETWWQSEPFTILQAAGRNDARSEATFVEVASLDAVVRALLAAESLRGHIGVLIQDRAVREVRSATAPVPPEEPPDPDGWRRDPSARRFAYDMGDPDVSGAVWVLGAPGRWEIQQVRVYKGRVRSWSTFTADGGVKREFR